MQKYVKSLFPYGLILVLFFYTDDARSQVHYQLNQSVSKRIDFELIGNLIILPIQVNGVMLSFVLDSGVSKPILFNISEDDDIGLQNTASFNLYGLGSNGSIEAVKSSNNTLHIGNVKLFNKDLYVVHDKSIDFTPRLGVQVHGIIGYDLFKDFVVEVNYQRRYLRLHHTKSFDPKMSRKWQKIPLEIYKSKPYIDTRITLNGASKLVKLLVDTGSSDALWLFEDSTLDLRPKSDLVFRDFLGKGLSGSVYGSRSKVDALVFGGFTFDMANVAFPDSASIDLSKVYNLRNGSLGGEILKRFNLFFDYSNNSLFLKKNANFNKPFTYNNSGIVVEHNGVTYVKKEIKIPFKKFNSAESSRDAVQIDYYVSHITTIKPAYEIVEIRTVSNAYEAGVRAGDILIKLNGKMAYEYKLSEINAILHGEVGKTVKLSIQRNGIEKSFKFKLDNVFKKKEPSD